MTHQVAASCSTIPVFYRDDMLANIDSYSPSAGKPRPVLKSWLDGDLPIELHNLPRVTASGPGACGTDMASPVPRRGDGNVRGNSQLVMCSSEVVPLAGVRRPSSMPNAVTYLLPSILALTSDGGASIGGECDFGPGCGRRRHRECLVELKALLFRRSQLLRRPSIDALSVEIRCSVFPIPPARTRTSVPSEARSPNEDLSIALVVTIDTSSVLIIKHRGAVFGVFGRLIELRFIKRNHVATVIDRIFEYLPRNRIAISAHAEKAAKLEHRVAHLTRNLVNHEIVDRA